MGIGGALRLLLCVVLPLLLLLLLLLLLRLGWEIRGAGGAAGSTAASLQQVQQRATRTSCGGISTGGCTALCCARS